MSERYGPQAAQIEALLERVRNLTDEEAETLRDAWDAVRGAAWAAWYAARGVAPTAARNAALAAAWGVNATWCAVRVAAWAAWDADRVAAWGVNATWSAVRDAIEALAVRHLIGQHGFTQQHYDAMVAPWESVMGTEWTREEA